MPPPLSRRVTALAIAPDEQIIFRIRQSGLLLVVQLLGLALLGFVLVTLVQNLPGDSGPVIGGLTINQLIALGVIVAISFVALVRILDFLTTTYTLTTRRVQKDFGILLKTSYAVPLAQIETLDVVQSVVGRILNYADILVRPTSTVIDYIVLAAVADPGNRREEIENQINV